MEEKKQPTGAEEHNTPEAPVADGPGTTRRCGCTL